VTLLPLPSVPWQITGNHWLSLPCIHPADGSLHAVGVLHRGSRSTVEFAGGPDFIDAVGPALLRPVLDVDGKRYELSGTQMAWERALGWIPTFTCAIGPLLVRGTIFAPYGRDADVAGAVYALAVENRGTGPLVVRLSLEGMFGHRQLRVRTPRPCDDDNRLTITPSNIVVLDGTAPPGLVPGIRPQTSELLAALVGFNVGVEIGQLAIVAPAFALVLGGAPADVPSEPLTSAFLSGLLQATTDRRVSVVNADAIARVPGISVDARGDSGASS